MNLLPSSIKSQTFGIFISSIMFCACSLTLAGAADNLVPEGDFENPGKDGSVPPGWTAMRGAALSDEQKHGGTYSLMLPILPDAERQNVVAGCWLESANFKPGDVVEISAYVMTTGYLRKGSYSLINLSFSDPNWKTWAEGKVDMPVEPTSEWEKVSGQVTVPAEFSSDWHVKLAASVWIDSLAEAPGAIFVDDIQVVVLPAEKK